MPKENFPKISIGLPVYNGEAFLRDALVSLLAQSFCDFEIVISDNASTDGTKAICDEFVRNDPRIRYIRQPQNLGAVYNFKFVLAQARADHFMWAAADDLWSENWIEKLLSIARDEGCIAVGTTEIVDETGAGILHPSNGRKIAFTGSRLRRRLAFFLEPSYLGKSAAIYGIFTRSKIAPAEVEFLKNTFPAWDVLLLFRALANMEILCAPEAILYNRKHEKSDSATAKPTLVSRTTLDRIFRKTLLHKYLAYSNVWERMFILMLFIPHLFAIRLGRLRFQLYRRRRPHNR